MVEEAAEIVVAAAVVVVMDQASVDTNPVHELLVALRLPKELGHGKHRSGQLPVLLTVEELWFIHGGL